MPANPDPEPDRKSEALEPVLRFLTNLRAFRERLGMDRKQMAEFLGYKRPGPYYRMEEYLNDKKRGGPNVHAPNIHRMWEICTFLDLDFYDMISEELDFSEFDTTSYLLGMMKKKRGAVDLYQDRLRESDGKPKK